MTPEQLTEIEQRADDVMDYGGATADEEQLAGEDVPALVAEVKRLTAERDADRAEIVALCQERLQLTAERDEARAALDRVREPLRAALAEWEPEYDYYRDRSGRKGYSHDEVAAEVYGKAIEVATKVLAEIDRSGT